MKKWVSTYELRYRPIERWTVYTEIYRL